MSDQEQASPPPTDASGVGGTSDDDRQPEDTGATGTLGEHDVDPVVDEDLPG